MFTYVMFALVIPVYNIIIHVQWSVTRHSCKCGVIPHIVCMTSFRCMYNIMQKRECRLLRLPLQINLQFSLLFVSVVRLRGLYVGEGWCRLHVDFDNCYDLLNKHYFLTPIIFFSSGP